MSLVKIRDLLWIWGMKVNALQETSDFEKMGFGRSALTVEQAMQETGIFNVYVAGGLPISSETIESIPSAKRIVCKTSVHRHVESKMVIDVKDVLMKLDASKKLAIGDRRIDAFSLDDFSTGSMTAGVTVRDMAEISFTNALIQPYLPIHGTVYPMSLNDPGLPAMLAYFDELLLPIWYVDDVIKSDEYIDTLNAISGGKPVLFCIYVYDFGPNRMLTRKQMQIQLDVVESLIHRKLVTGCVLLGTCMFDLGWEAVECMYEWIRRVGDNRVEI